MKIAIPSYHRPDVLTWTFYSQIYNPKDMFIFVNDDTQKQEYLKVNPNYQIIVTNKIGIQKNRNFILDYFKAGEKILMLDDDVRDVYKLGDKCLIKLTNKEIIDFIEDAFKKTEDAGAKLWGIYMIKNHFFMSDKIKDKAFIIGSFCGIINNSLRYNEILELKEDYDYTIKNVITYGKILRFDNITANIKHYTNKGGCVETRKTKKNLEAKCCKRLMKMYPDHLRINKKRQNEVIIKK